MIRHAFPDQLRSLAVRQAGAFSAGQANDLGLGRRTLSRLRAEGWVDRLSMGTYCIGSPTWPTLAWAGLLIGGQHAVIGGAAAAHLRGLMPEPEVITIYCPIRRQLPTGETRWVFIRGRRSGSGNPSRTRVEDTILDCLGDLSGDSLIRLVDEALTRRLTTPRRLRFAINERSRLRGRRLLLEVLGEIDAGVRSPLEVRYRRDVERAHGLPVPVRQARLGARVLDGWYPDWGVVIEMDGAAFHSGSRAIDDLVRDAEHAARGLITLRFGWSQVTQNPCEVAVRVAQTLAARGWTGDPRRCPHCRAR